MPPKRVSMLRPIQAGTRIVNPAHGTLGTIGLVCRDANDMRWLLSCAHVLNRPAGFAGTPAGDLEPIHQPKDKPEYVIAHTDLAKVLPDLDAAAARIDDAIADSPEVLDIGPATEPAAPTAGLTVIKSGSRTGVTRGIVRTVAPELVIIEPLAGATGALTKKGDSGAVWLDAATLAPVAMHTQGNVGGTERSISVPIMAVLMGLGLTPAPAQPAPADQ